MAALFVSRFFSAMALTVKQRFFLAILVLAFPLSAISGDPDIISDFVVPIGVNATVLDGNFFTYTGMRPLINSDPPTNFTVTKATMAEFPALNGQSVSYAVLEYPAGSVNPPHTHPRAAELLFLTYGILEVGFVDTTNKLFTQRLQAGDIFVFPKGLVHYQFNCAENDFAVAVSAFGSAAAGTVSVPSTVFATSIDDEILAKSFKTDVQTIQKLKAGFAPKA
ncbi:germin-like protein 9-3 [Gossypium arboreum]|nr:germin-like protein 9-3 [Gossypium arboreum]